MKLFLLFSGSMVCFYRLHNFLPNSMFVKLCRASDDHAKLATIYKSEKRNEMIKEGYRILGNSGDQWSDLLGSSPSVRSFKLPNPMYYIP
jgi:hypothetical protein